MRNNISYGSSRQLQYSVMPTATEGLLGLIIQYVGATDSSYTNGYFYKCVVASDIYSWSAVPSIKVNGSDVTSGYLTDKLVGANNSGISFTPSADNSKLEMMYEPAKAYKESLINYPANFINSWAIETRAYSIFTVFNPLCLFKTSTSKVIFHNSTEQTLKGHCLVKIFKYSQTELNFTEVAKTEEMDMTTQTAGKDIAINFLSTSEDLNPYDTYYLCLTSDEYNAFYGYDTSTVSVATTTAAPFNFKAQNISYATMVSTTSFSLSSEWCSPSGESIWFMLKQNS